MDAGHLLERESGLELTESGEAFLDALGDVKAARNAKRPTIRPCLDWTERRQHLAGSAATGLLDALIAKKWIARSNTPRAIRVTEKGRTAIFDYFNLN